MVSLMMARQWTDQLADVAESLVEKVPDNEDWDSLRSVVRDTSALLKKGDASCGIRAFQQALPYVGKVFGSVEKYLKVNDTFEITESLGEHFLIDSACKELIEKALREVRLRLDELRGKIEDFGRRLDTLLERTMTGEGSSELGVWVCVKLAFNMNRIQALMTGCDGRLRQIRIRLDQLDTHVAGKNLMASLITYFAFFGSVALSATGNIPAGAACLATATATNKSSRDLVEYQRQLRQIDVEHRELEQELCDWRASFEAEQRNMLLLIGAKWWLLILLLFAALFFVLGAIGNFFVFGVVSVVLLFRAEKYNCLRSYGALVVCALALALQLHTPEVPALSLLNTCAAALALCKTLAFLQLV